MARTSRDPLLVSIVVPTRNRPVQLHACLAALAAQSFDHERFEVLVVDDGGEVPLQEELAQFSQQINVRLLVQEHRGPARARNVGAAEARGTLLAFTDDDCEPASGWLSGLHECFRADNESAFGGHTVNALPENAYSTASQLLVDYLYAYYSRTAALGQALGASAFLTSNNIAMSATRYKEIGGFDETFPLPAGEDRDLCDRWLHQGYRLRVVPDAVIRHSHHLSLRRFWRQHMNYGRGACHLRRARLAKARQPQSVEPLSFYIGLVLFPLSSATRRRGQLVCLMALSQVANVLGFLIEAVKRSHSAHDSPQTCAK